MERGKEKKNRDQDKIRNGMKGEEKETEIKTKQQLERERKRRKQELRQNNSWKGR